MKVIKMEPFLALFACSRSPFSLNDAVFLYGGAERMTSREGGRAQVHLIKTILFPCSPGLMRNRPPFMKQTITSAERARALLVSCCAGRAAGRVGTAVGVVRVQLCVCVRGAYVQRGALGGGGGGGRECAAEQDAPPPEECVQPGGTCVELIPPSSAPLSPSLRRLSLCALLSRPETGRRSHTCSETEVREGR